MKIKSILLIVGIFLLISISFSSFAQEPHWSKYKYPTELPPDAKIHYIVKGDTLWDLAAHYLGDPFLWPKIWEANKYITDPDLIFPQDPLIIPEVEVVPEEEVEEEVPEEEAEEIAKPEEEVEKPAEEEAVPPPLIALASEADIACSPMIIKNPDNVKMKIIGAEEKIAMGLSIFDIIYIDSGLNQGVNAGEQYTIIRKGELVYNHSNGDKLGFIYIQEGVAKVIAVQNDSSIAQIISGCDFVNIGDNLIPYKETPIPMVESIPELDKFAPPSGKAEGSIIYSKDDQIGLGEHSLVFIDLGTNQNIKPGDFFSIFEMQNAEGREIRQVVGQLVVLRTEENSSLCRIIKSLKDISIGCRVELQ